MFLTASVQIQNNLRNNLTIARILFLKFIYRYFYLISYCKNYRSFTVFQKDFTVSIFPSWFHSKDNKSNGPTAFYPKSHTRLFSKEKSNSFFVDSLTTIYIQSLLMGYFAKGDLSQRFKFYGLTEQEKIS